MAEEGGGLFGERGWRALVRKRVCEEIELGRELKVTPSARGRAEMVRPFLWVFGVIVRKIQRHKTLAEEIGGGWFII